MDKVFRELYQSAVVPVVTLEDREKALRLAEALQKGHMFNLEIAMRNDAAAECITAVHEAYPNIALGAGTVLTLDQLESARQAGARYAVSPGYDEEFVNKCIEIGMPVIPGTIQSTDIIKGLKAGLQVIKFFPSEPHGGLETINYLAAPFRTVKFLPAGGIGFSNLEQYLDNPAVFACAGGFMARSSQIQSGDWAAITELCEKIHTFARKRLDKYPYPFA